MINEWQQDSLPVASTDILNRPEAWSDSTFYNTYGFGVSTPSGKRVTPETALKVSVVMSCVLVLSEAIASLPLKAIRENDDGEKEKIRKHNLVDLLDTLDGIPNKWQTAYEFREMMTGHVALRGNAYAEIISDNSGRIIELVPIHPDRVEPERLENGRIRYKLRAYGDFSERLLTQDEVFHIRWFSSDGIVGLSPITHAANSIGLAQAAEEHGSGLFRNGARPGGVLTHPGKLPPEAPEQLRSEWNKFYGGSKNSHNVAVMQGGMSFQEIGITPEDAQYLETRKFQMEDIARIYRVPPHMVGIMEHATFTNIEHQSIDFVKYTLAPWLIRWESSASRDLILEDNVKLRHNVDGLLRGDSEARFSQYQIALNNMIMTRNEVRRLENLEPVDGGDEFMVPLNMAKEEDIETEPIEEEENEALAAMLADASRRIASAELRELDKRVKHAASDPDRFNAWVTDYYSGKYASYVTQTIEPIYTAFNVTGIEDAVKAVAGDAILTLATGIPVDVFEDWKDSRVSALTHILKDKANDKSNS